MKISNESKVGILAALSITLMILGYNYMKGRDLFTSTKTYYAVFEKVDGLVASNPVMINGYRIGQVTNVEMLHDDSLKLLVEIEVQSKIRVPKNSTIKVYSSDLFGGKSIELVLGNSPEEAQNKDVLIPYMEPGLVDNLNQITLPLREKVTNILSGLDSTLNGPSGLALREAMETLPGTMNQLNATLVSVQKTMDVRVAELLQHANKIASTIEKNSGEIDRVIKNMASISDTLAALELQATLMRANSAVGELNTFLNNINEGKGTLGQLAQNEALYNEMKNVSHDLDELLKDMKARPKRYVHFSIFGKKDKEAQK